MEARPFANEFELRVREIQAMETMAESFRIIAVNFSKMIELLENDVKEDQAFRKLSQMYK